MQDKNEIITVGICYPESSDKMHQTNVVYGINGIAATIRAVTYKDPPKILVIKNEEIHNL